MKNTLPLTTLVALLALPAAGALPSTIVRTNLQIATVLTNGATYTYAGTNYVDSSRYAEVGWELKFQGTNSDTGNIVVSFKRSADGTNYETSPLYYWVVPMNGTSARLAITNWTAGVVGNYWQPYQFVNTNSSDGTNASFWGYLKGYRRE